MFEKMQKSKKRKKNVIVYFILLFLGMFLNILDDIKLGLFLNVIINYINKCLKLWDKVCRF